MSHDHDLTKSVWCPKCEHTHVPNIPQWTWVCRDCGFGSWGDVAATNHEISCPTHHVYAEEHPVVPLSERPAP
jgi:ribosomal protein L37AE/L43A